MEKILKIVIEDVSTISKVVFRCQILVVASSEVGSHPGGLF